VKDALAKGASTFGNLFIMSSLLKVFRTSVFLGRVWMVLFLFWDGPACSFEVASLGREGLERLEYRNPGLVVDLGVGLWAEPMPMDYDGDGDLDLVVSCSDVPYRGTYFFENPGGHGSMPVFKPAVRIGDGMRGAQVSFVHGKPVVMSPGVVYPDFCTHGYVVSERLPLPANVHENKVRANHWRMVDYNGNGVHDVIVGVGDWTEYGWDNAYNERGEWTRGPLRGYVYLILNEGTDEKPEYASAVKMYAGDEPVNVFGMPCPNLADFDGDGDLDLLCGEFVDSFTYFENVGTRKTPIYAPGRPLLLDGEVLRMDLCMIVPVAVDWNGNGNVDLVVGQEDGRVALLEHTGEIQDGLPCFKAPRFFQQEAECVKFGALVTPVGFDWDGDGDDDLIAGNTSGRIAFIENLDGGYPPRWAAPIPLRAGGEEIRITAGSNGSIQGPCEAKWGYTTLSVSDWDHDGLPDLVVNSIWGKVVWYRNVGTRTLPELEPGQPVIVEWTGEPPKPAWNWWDPEGKGLVSQWRTTPVVVDWNEDGWNDLVMLDQEGYLVLFQREKREEGLVLLPPRRIFHGSEGPLQLNAGVAGRSGRRKLCCVDWDGDGLKDFLVNGKNVEFFKNLGREGDTFFLQNEGPVDIRTLAGHTTSPTVVDWNQDGVPDLLVGAEDGFLYYMKNPRTASLHLTHP